MPPFISSNYHKGKSRRRTNTLLQMHTDRMSHSYRISQERNNMSREVKTKPWRRRTKNGVWMDSRGMSCTGKVKSTTVIRKGGGLPHSGCNNTGGNFLQSRFNDWRCGGLCMNSSAIRWLNYFVTHAWNVAQVKI